MSHPVQLNPQHQVAAPASTEQRLLRTECLVERLLLAVHAAIAYGLMAASFASLAYPLHAFAPMLKSALLHAGSSVIGALLLVPACILIGGVLAGSGVLLFSIYWTLYLRVFAGGRENGESIDARLGLKGRIPVYAVLSSRDFWTRRRGGAVPPEQ